MFAPQVVKEIERGAGGRQLENYLIKPSRLIVLVGGTIVFGFVTVGKQFLAIVYGEEYLIAWVVALIIMFPMLLNMSNGILINVLDAKNLRMSRSLVLLITTLANILLTLLWVDRWGMIGASVATAICTVIGQITLMNIYYSKKLHIDVLYMYQKTFTGILVWQVIAAFAGNYATRWITNSFVAFVAGGLIYVALFAIFFLIDKANSEEKAETVRIFKRLTRMEK